MAIPTFQGTDFVWRAGRGNSHLSLLGLEDFPSQFYIKSHKTGQVKLFLYDEELMVENEFFDGEAMAYFCPAGNLRVQLWR